MQITVLLVVFKGWIIFQNIFQKLLQPSFEVRLPSVLRNLGSKIFQYA